MVGVAAAVKCSTGSLRPRAQPEVSGFIYLLASMAVIGGFLFGYDTGIVSSAMLFVVNNRRMRPVSHLWQELIVAITPAFAALGSLFAGLFGDRFGRRKLILISSLIFAVGAMVCALALNKEALLAGRILLGVAIGVASMIVPVYVSECSPTHVRGQLLTGFNMMVCFGQMAANVVAGGFSYLDEDNLGWRLMFGFAALPALVQFVGFLHLPESPRWLFSNVGEKASREVLSKVYDRAEEWIDYEISEIASTHEQETLSMGSDGPKKPNVLRKVLTTPHVRKALLIGCGLQLFQQLSGINTIMYYTGTLIKSAGVADNRTTIWLSCVTSFVNFIGNLIPFLVVERLGRRRALLASMAAVVLALAALGTAFYTVNRDTAAAVAYERMEGMVGVRVALTRDEQLTQHCLALSNCDFCVSEDRCGFCQPEGFAVGVCLPTDPYHSDVRSADGFCASASNGSVHDFEKDVHFQWTDVYCKTKYTMLPLVIMVVYLLVFSAGYAPLPWVLNAEFYPLWARGTCVALATCTNWAANLLVSATFLSLSAALTRFGTFYAYALVTLGALLVCARWVPETKDCSIDEVELLFMSAESRRLLADQQLRRPPRLSRDSADNASGCSFY